MWMWIPITNSVQYMPVWTVNISFCCEDVYALVYQFIWLGPGQRTQAGLLSPKCLSHVMQLWRLSVNEAFWYSNEKIHGGRQAQTCSIHVNVKISLFVQWLPISNIKYLLILVHISCWIHLYYKTNFASCASCEYAGRGSFTRLTLRLLREVLGHGKMCDC